ncbi:hypothetical protein BH11CYA1_BH11CYA1_17760 [soil metagenome]
MSSGESNISFSSNAGTRPRTPLFTWLFVALQVVIVAMAAVMLDKPMGAIAGRVAIEQKGFHLKSYDLKDNKVFVLATGPRTGPSVERGAWVNNDGTFKIEQLPVGEYTIRVRAPGFSTAMVNNLFVVQGKPQNIPEPVQLTLLSPTVNIASNTRVFTTKEAPHFWVNATGASDAKVQVYKQDFLSLISSPEAKKMGISLASDFNIYVDSSKKFASPFAKMTPVANFSRKLTMDDSDSANAQFKFDHALPAGDYFAHAEVTDMFGHSTASALTWFSVSDVGLIVKHSPDKTVVKAVDLNTLKGIGGVDLKIFSRDGDVSKTASVQAKTAADGIATLLLPKDIRSRLSYDLVLLGSLGASKAYSGYNYYRSDSDTHKTYFYTDRPVYRLGQTVFFKGMCRAINENGIANVGAGEELDLTVEDPDNNELKTLHVKTNAHGTFHGLIEVPTDGKTGGYQVQIKYADGTISYQGFEIAQYRKPEYQVEVLPITERVIAGEKGKARIKATYFFGGPVANARVKYNVYSSTDWNTRWRLMDRPAFYSFFDDWYDADYYEGAGDFSAEGYAVTDANGEAIVEFATTAATPPTAGPLGSEFADKKLKVEAEVTDISRLSVVGSGSMFESAGDFLLAVTPTNYVVSSGQPMAVDIKAVDYKGVVVKSKNLKIKVVRYPWDRFKSEYRPDQVLEEKTATTDDAGNVHVDLETKGQWESDSYYVIAQATDSGGHIVQDASSIWVSSTEKPFFLGHKDAQKEPLKLKLDKRVYKPGETAKLIITGPFTGKDGAEAIVSIEGTKLHSFKTIPLTSAAQLVEIPVKQEFTPNFYVTVSLVAKNKQFYNQEQVIMVSPDNHFLNLTIASDKEKYKPGEEATYTIKALDQQGKPVKGVELSLGVVDESIYSIRAETAADIKKFFYERLPNWVTTVCSFPEQYSGGPDKLEPKVRKDFRDTAAWVPELVTNEKGEAKAVVKLPDNLTTWRTTVRGIDMATNVGATIQKIMVTQDIIARLALPRFYSIGDEANVTAIVHNYTDKTQKVSLNLTMGPELTSKVALSQALTVEADKAARFDWPVTASKLGTTKIKLVARGETAADALEKEIAVNPLGIQVTLIKSGLLANANDSLSLNIPAITDAGPGTLTRNLTLSSSTIGTVLDKFAALIDYPYGCTEQTMSRLMPSVVAMELNKKLSAPLSPADTTKFGKVYKEGMAKLKEYQHGDGGWGWWAGDTTSAYLTPLVLEGLKLVKGVGYSVEESMVSKGLSWQTTAIKDLSTQLSDPKHVVDKYFDGESQTDLAYMLFTQALWQKKLNKSDEAAVTYLTKYQASLGPETLSYFARALKLAGRDEEAQRILNRLLNLANTTDDTVDWERSKAMLAKLGPSIDEYNYYTYRFTPEETTALCLTTVLEVRPTETSKIERVKSWILLHRGETGWGTTKATAQVFKALLADELCAQAALGGKVTNFTLQALLGAGSATKTETGAETGSNIATSTGASSETGVTASSSPAATALAKVAASLDLGKFDFTVADRLTKGKTVSWPASANQAGSNTLQLTKNGDGRLYWAVTTTYYKSLMEEGATGVANLPSDLKLERQFYRLKSTADTTSGIINVKAEPLAGAPIKAGETILMKILVDTPRSLPYVIVEANLPSGAEVVDSKNQANTVEGGEEAAVEGDWGRPWWTHQDILDDKIVYFGSNVPIGKSQFTTLLRMELPGRVKVNPAMLAGMYTKNIKGYTKVDRLNITE